MRSTLWALAVALLVVACGGGDSTGGGGSTPPPPPPTVNTANDGSPLGTNLGGLNYFSTQVPFIDVFKTSAPWFSGSAAVWNDGRAIDVDADGWVRSLLPDQVARTLMLAGRGVYPTGKYIVLYEGDGAMVYDIGWTRVAAESTPGRDVVELTSAAAQLGLYLTRTNPANPLKNIRVLLSGGVCGNEVYVRAANASECPAGDYRSFEATHTTLVFNPQFVERTRKYKVLRHMDWMEANSENQSGAWAARPRMTQARWNGQGGAPLEVMIELANRLNTYPWFNIPHRADDDYVRNFAQTVRDKLAPGLKVYIEYSNETWNDSFPQAFYAAAQAQAAGIAVAGDAYTSRIRWHARRAPQIFDVWTSVFGGNTRLVRVLGGQAESAYLTDVVAGFENAHLKADALGLNAYFGLAGVSSDADAERFAALTNAQAFAEFRANPLPTLFEQVKAQNVLAAKYKLKLIAFESGNSLWPPFPARDNTGLEAKLTSIQRDPEMKALYTEFLNGWFDNGGQLLMHFADCSQYGASGGWFGSMEYIYQPRNEAPKYDALMTFIDNNRNRIVP